MSKTVSFKRLRAQDVAAHVESIKEALLSNEIFESAVSKAKEMGVSVLLETFDTYTDEKRGYYHLPEDQDDLPYGMQKDVLVSLTKDGRALFITDQEGTPVQLCTALTALHTQDSFFGKKAQLLDPKDADVKGAALMVEGFLEQLAEYEEKTSVVTDASACPLAVELDPSVSFTNDVEGAVEVLAGEFAGIYENEGSAYFSQASFLPFAYLLEGRQFGFYKKGGVSVIDEAAWEVFKQDLQALCGRLNDAVSFADLLTEVDIFSLQPTAANEALLCEVVIRRADAFFDVAQAFLEYGDLQIAQKGCLSVIW